MYTPLMLGSGILWTLTYILMIRRGFKDKTYGMPLAALSANIAWEFIFSFIEPCQPPQLYVNIIWFSFDAIILYQFFKYGMSEIKGLSRTQFIAFSLLSLTIGFFAVLFITYEFKDFLGAYSAFSQNLMMSILFVVMLYRRNSARGQSIYIAVFKCIGTVFPSLAFYLYQGRFHGSLFMNFLYISIFVFDLIYIVNLYQKCKEEGINPWKRF